MHQNNDTVPQVLVGWTLDRRGTARDGDWRAAIACDAEAATQRIPRPGDRGIP
jgi:hypothetical protein